MEYFAIFYYVWMKTHKIIVIFFDISFLQMQISTYMYKNFFNKPKKERI
jgi:hypothetical protein